MTSNHIRQAAEDAAWGTPGSFLLPKAIRLWLDDRPVPDTVRGYLPMLERGVELRSAFMPAGWVYLPGVARELQAVFREPAARGLHVVAPDDLDWLVDSDEGLLRLAKELTGEISEAAVRRLLEESDGGRTSPGSLLLATLNDLWAAAGHQAEHFLRAAAQIDSLLHRLASAEEEPPEAAAPESARPEPGCGDIDGSRGHVGSVPGEGEVASAALDSDVTESPAPSETPHPVDLLEAPLAVPQPDREPAVLEPSDHLRLWGSWGAPLLPIAVENLLADVQLPGRICELAGLPSGSTAQGAVVRRPDTYLPALAAEVDLLLGRPDVRRLPAVGYDIERAVLNDAALRGLLLREVDEWLRHPAARARLRARMQSPDDLGALDAASIGDIAGLNAVGPKTLLSLTVGMEQLLRHWVSPGRLVDKEAGLHRQASAQGGYFLDKDVRDRVATLSPVQWERLFHELPLVPGTRTALLTAAGGEVTRLQRLLVEAVDDEADRTLYLDGQSRREVNVELRLLLNIGMREHAGPRALPDDLVEKMSRCTPTEWEAVVDGLPTRLRNTLLRAGRSHEGVRSFLAQATDAELADLRQFGNESKAILLNALAGLPSAQSPTRTRESAQTPAGDHPLFAEERVPVFSEPPLEPVANPEQFRGDDPRFAGIIKPYVDLADAEIFVADKASLRTVYDSIRLRCAELATPLIEGEALRLLAAAAQLPEDHPRLVALGGRFGITGQSLLTLDEAGQLLGVTRERVRQLQQAVKRKLPLGPVWAPALDQALQLLDVVVPCSAKDLNAALAEAGLTEIEWTAESLVAVAALSGRELTLAEQDGLVGSEEDLAGLKGALSTARRVSDRNGAASYEQVVEELSAGRSATTVELVRAVLVGHPDVTELEEGWFWTRHGKGRNRLVNNSLRILAVFQPQTLEDMVGGIERNYTWRNSTGGADRKIALEVPPVNVLASFYASHPEFVISDGIVSSAAEIDPEILGPEKLTLVSVLRDQPWCAMSRNDLIAACAAEGMRTSTVQVFLTYAECIKNVGHNIWALRGVAVPPAAVEEMQQSARSGARAFDKRAASGTTAGGRPWLAQRISPGVLYSGVLSGRWTRHLPEDGQLSLIDGVDGDKVGTLKRSGDLMHGFARLLRKHQPRVGDAMRVTLYMEDGYSVVEIGGDELLEEPEDW